jgi:tetratricopeptide (TPR) repeat protein
MRAQCRCGKWVEAPESAAGKVGKCPSCGELIQIPRNGTGQAPATPGPRTGRSQATGVPAPKPFASSTLINSPRSLAIVAGAVVLVVAAIITAFLLARQPKAVRMARDFMEIGAYDQAIELLLFEQERDPTSTTPIFLLGECFVAKGDLRSAREWLNKVCTANPGSRDDIEDLYLRLLSEEPPDKDYGKWLRVANAAVEFSPTLSERVADVCLEEAQTAMEGGKTRDAVTLAHTAGELLPTARPRAAETLIAAISLLAYEESPREIARLAREVVQWNPSLGSELAKKLLAVSDTAAADLDGAGRGWFRMLAELDRSQRGEIGGWLLTKAGRFVEGGAFGDAVTAAELAAEIDPDARTEAAEVPLDAARKMLEASQIDAETEAYLRRARELDPTRADRIASLCLDHAAKQRQAGNRAGQLTLLDWAARQDPRKRADVAKIHQAAMNESLRAGRYDEAVEHARLAAKVAPDASIQTSIGATLESTGVQLISGSQKNVGLTLISAARSVGYKLKSATEELIRPHGSLTTWDQIRCDRSASTSIGASFLGDEIRLSSGPGTGLEHGMTCSVEMYQDFELEFDFELTPESYGKHFAVELPVKPSGTKVKVNRTAVEFWPVDSHFQVRHLMPESSRRDWPANDAPWKYPGNGEVNEVRIQRIGGKVAVYCAGEEAQLDIPQDQDPFGPRQIRLITWKGDVIIRNLRIRRLSSAGNATTADAR